MRMKPGSTARIGWRRVASPSASATVLAAFSFYFAGLQHLEPTRAVVVSCLEPVFSIVIAAIALGEILRPLQAVGIVLVLAAIIVVQMPEQQKAAEITLIEPVD